MEEILGLIVDALRKRGAAGAGNLAPPPQAAPRGAAPAPAPQVGNTSAEIAAAIERANAADAPSPAPTAPVAPRAPAPPRAPASPQRPAAVPRAATPVAPAAPPRLLAGFGNASAFLQAFVVSEALAPPVTLRPPSH